MPDVDVVVIGAGLAGLGAATALRAAGRTAVVLEAADRIGGRAWTTYPSQLGGVPFGHDPHEVLELVGRIDRHDVGGIDGRDRFGDHLRPSFGQRPHDGGADGTRGTDDDDGAPAGCDQVRRGSGDKPFLVSNRNPNIFRVIEVEGSADGSELSIPDDAATVLELRAGDTLRVAPGYRRAG